MGDSEGILRHAVSYKDGVPYLEKKGGETLWYWLGLSSASYSTA